MFHAGIEYLGDGEAVVTIFEDGAVYNTYTMRSDLPGQWTEQELAILNGPKGDCEHGLSAALCSGPMHY